MKLFLILILVSSPSFSRDFQSQVQRDSLNAHIRSMEDTPNEDYNRWRNTILVGQYWLQRCMEKAALEGGDMKECQAKLNRLLNTVNGGFKK